MGALEYNHIWKDEDLEGLEARRSRLVSHIFPKHFHDTYGFGLTGSGHGLVFSRGAKHIASCGDFIFLRPGQVHSGHPQDQETWEYAMLYFDPSVVEAQIGVKGTLHLGNQTVFREKRLMPAFMRLFEVLLYPVTVAEKESAYRDFLTVWGQAASISNESSYNRREVKLKIVRDYIMAHWDGEFSVDELAGKVGLNPRYLIGSFRQAYGLPPHQYQIQVRLNKALAMLREGKDIAQVATDCGFYDQSHLTRTFKKCHGFTPGVMRPKSRIRCNL
ncbi:AraC family transcriptional regulator [Sulfidibacter corallicola]|uniref:AraC family transcriptional regulator n=1 Tax=Sulfidibacter corallicola TaxID=2818388 RepID=A0A8A4TDZ2_SULCO|nr:AraC family transcriptional regulator [Sulfidibacter corallicola]QTD48156.1 AraC family transcriptional regulator [Sulfidibacter corallicola]